MNTATHSQRAFHRGTAPIFAILSKEQVRYLTQLEADASLADRIDQLASKCNEGDLTTEEQEEYEAYIEANNLLAVLQAEAQFRLKTAGACPFRLAELAHHGAHRHWPNNR
ncbi:MAG TPA: hypothetical protein PLY87_27990 [Planctomycetaceae bacterium]|nr:hypothetical protein [Planctomycetaceae bacterium]HQZ68972.1 hypothetical protein [Planctomycetaceae bacterium]